MCVNIKIDEKKTAARDTAALNKQIYQWLYQTGSREGADCQNKMAFHDRSEKKIETKSCGDELKPESKTEKKIDTKSYDYVLDDDIIDFDAEKKRLKVFSHNHDIFIEKMINSAIKVVEQVINKKITAKPEKYQAHVEYVNDLHGKIQLPLFPVLRVDRVVIGQTVVKDFTLIESGGKAFVLIPFLPSNLRSPTKIEIHYMSGMVKNDLNDNIKTAVSMVLHDLYEGREFKNDNMTSLKILLANEINYNL